jgi:hypothetical protein
VTISGATRGTHNLALAPKTPRLGDGEPAGVGRIEVNRRDTLAAEADADLFAD